MILNQNRKEIERFRNSETQEIESSSEERGVMSNLKIL